MWNEILSFDLNLTQITQSQPKIKQMFILDLKIHTLRKLIFEVLLKQETHFFIIKLFYSNKRNHIPSLMPNGSQHSLGLL